MTTSQSMILGMGKNNIFNTLKLISKHRPEIEAHLKGQTYEGLNSGPIIPGMSNTAAIITIVISLLVWLWAFYVTVKYFNQLSIVSQIFAIMGLLGFVGGPVITLLAVYIGLSAPPASSATKGSKFLGKY